jgi:hypothetical protein
MGNLRNSNAAWQYEEDFEEAAVEEYRRPELEQYNFEQQVDVLMPEIDANQARPDFGRGTGFRGAMMKKPQPFVIAMECYLDSRQLPHYEYHPIDFRSSTRPIPSDSNPSLLSGPDPLVLLGAGASMRITTSMPEEQSDLRMVMILSLIAMFVLALGTSWLSAA